jgi:serine/threonine-protein kinase
MKPSPSLESPEGGRMSDPPRSRDWLASGELVAEKYQLKERLGKGAMGSVWAATHLALETPVAVKFLTWDAEPDAAKRKEEPTGSATSESQKRGDARTRFEREAKAAAQIRSANVVQVFDYGVDRGVPFIVMELLDGEDLNKRLQREGKLPPSAVARLVQAISRALQRAHDMGLVHRDLKPGNIFLAREGDHEVPKVVDFGVVKTLGSEQKIATDGSENTMEGTLIGTPSYMSPEQAMGRTDVDHRSDLWSFSVILFQVLTGMKPFPGGNLFEALVRICSDPVPRPSSIAPDLPAGTDAFFERALERDVGKRFQSARELERAFYALVARPSTSVPPPEPMGEPGDGAPAVHREDASSLEVHGLTVHPPARKPRLLVAAGVGALVLLAGGVIAWKSSATTSAVPIAQPPVAAATVSAAPTEPASAAADPVPAPSSAPVASSAPATASAPASATSEPVPAAHAVAAPHVGAAAAAPRPAAPAQSHKPKRDLGY